MAEDQIIADLSADTDAVSDNQSPSNAAPDAGTTPATEGSPADGQPGSGQPGSEGQTPSGEEGQNPAAAESGEGDEASQEDADKQIRASLGLPEKDINTAEHWRERYSASSREAKKLSEANKQLQELLSRQGTKAVQNDDGELQLAADSEWVEGKANENFADVWKGIDGDTRDLAMDNPEQFAKVIYQKAAESLASQPRPEIRLVDQQMSADEISELRREIDEQQKDDKGEMPGLELLEPYLDALLQSDKVPKEFRKVMHSSPENFRFGMDLLYSKVHRAAAPLLARLKDGETRTQSKKKGAKETVSTASDSSGVGNAGGRAQGGSTEGDEGDEIVKAKPMW